MFTEIIYPSLIILQQASQQSESGSDERKPPSKEPPLRTIQYGKKEPETPAKK